MKTVLVTGTFDFLHGGHLYMLKNAGKYGDKLVVLIARDKTVKKIKGQLPIHTEDERRELVSHLDMVDKAVLGDQKDPFKVITKIKPDVICLGYDQQHTFSLQLKEALEDRGLKTRIVQLKPHKEKRLKSSQLRKKIHGEESTIPRQFVAVTALVVKNGKILICKRNDPANKKFHKKWEFPGGGVEEGESIKSSLKRETKEETGLKIRIKTLVPYVYLGEYHGKSGYGQLYVLTYLCEVAGGRIAPHDKEVIECKWIDPVVATRYKMLPGNQEIIKAAMPLISYQSF